MLLFFFVLIVPYLVWETKCVMASGVCEGKERTFLTWDLSFYSCGKMDLILEDIPFVSICFYTFIISKELPTGYAISALNSDIYIQVSFKYVYLREPKVGIMSRIQHLSFCVSKEVATFT